ncbi:M14/M99 family metallopeptidase [Deltaproteobacteria bacterium]|nr:M14/M99 family metallopeptidase [Deltaproteobacteria bacterium]
MHLELISVKRVFYLLTSLIILPVLIHPSHALSKREHQVYFPNTAYELNIYRIYGKNPGKTLMLIGGIQGNEPGGFLSADLYADMSLERGNLIVVPRANFYSIILNQRGPHGDMNRKFTHEDFSLSMEDKIVTILKDLVSESDFLLNLHDGSGYYYPEYISKWRNPTCFGQTIIADCDSFGIPGTDDVIPLGEMAQQVIDEINQHINNELYKFHFMNTRTGEDDSVHKEQRKSATYYALNVHHIPAFGVETSKFLPSNDLKVWFHNLVINAFMKRFDIISQSPGLALDAPSLRYLIVSVNGNIPIVIKNNEILKLFNGDSINVSHIEANYERGLSLDILGYGDLNDYRKDLTIFRDTTMIVRKDNIKFGEFPIIISAKATVEENKTDRHERIDYFAIETNGHRLLLSEGETLELVMGDKMNIIEVFPSDLSGINVNFKGFVGNQKNNVGEDRGYEIDTANDLIKRYSINKNGEYYPIIVFKGDNEIGKMIVKLAPPKMNYLVLRINENRHALLRTEDSISLSLKDRICMEEIDTSLFTNSGIHLSINGKKLGLGELRELRDLCTSQRNQLNIQKGSLLLGKIFINMEEN